MNINRFVVLIVIFWGFASISAGEFKVVESLAKQGGWVADNEFYRIGFTHRGSINELYFKGSAKGIKSLYVSHESIGQYRMYNHAVTKGEIRKISDAEINLIFNVTFPGSPSEITAIYSYTFYASKPVVKVNIKVMQKKRIKIGGGLNDFLFSNSYFTDWAVGEDFKSDAIGTQQDAIPTDWKKGYSWTELFNFEDAFGIITIGTKPRSVIYCYNPQKYYIKGSSALLSNKLKYSFEQYIYVGPSENGKAVQNWARKLKNLK